MFRAQRPRLRSSALSIDTCEQVLLKWLDCVGDRHMAVVLAPAGRGWYRHFTPSPKQLCDPIFFKLTDLFIAACSKLNPAAVQLTSAILALHAAPTRPGYKPSKVLRGTNDFLEAKKLAGIIRLVVSRYRGIAKTDVKTAAVLAKAMTLRKLWAFLLFLFF